MLSKDQGGISLKVNGSINIGTAVMKGGGIEWPQVQTGLFCVRRVRILVDSDSLKLFFVSKGRIFTGRRVLNKSFSITLFSGCFLRQKRPITEKCPEIYSIRTIFSLIHSVIQPKHRV